MRRVITAFTKNIVFANIVLTIVFVAGAFACFNMIREIFPEFSVNVIQVVVPYPGADPEEVEEGISRKVEEAVDGLEGVKRYSTMSSENMGGAYIEVLESYDVIEVKDRVRNAIDSISTFPVDAEKPIVSEITIRHEVLTLGLSGPLGEQELKEWGERFKEELRLLPEVSQVEVLGTRDYEIAIEVSEERLREYGLTFAQVAQAVRASSLNMAGGVLRTRGEEIRLRTIGRRYRGEEFASLVLLARPQGEIITLDRVAEIRDGFTEDPIVSRLDGEPCVVVTVYKTQEEDAITISNAVRDYVDQSRATLPEGLSMTIWSDTSTLIEARIRLLAKNGLIGLTLVFLLLWMFLDLRLSFWVSLGIPTSLAGALAIMWLTGGTINMISLFGLIMVLGIVVDDAIVVGEAIYVHRKRGDAPVDAAVNGVSEVGLPVIAAVTTTIVAFMPLMFVGGIMGKFIYILPIAVIASLTTSLVECLILLPAHLGSLPDLNVRKHRRGLLRRVGMWLRSCFGDGLERFVERVYVPFVTRAVHWRYVGLCIAIAVLLVTLGLVNGGFVKFVMFSSVDGDDMSAQVEFPDGTPVEVTREAVERIEAALERIAVRTPTITGEPLVKHVFSIIGSRIEADDGYGRAVGPHAGAVRVALLESQSRGKHSKDLMVEWEEEIGPIPGAVALTFSGLRAGPPGKPIEIWLQGEDMDAILAASEKLMAKLSSYEGLYQVESDFRPGKNELRLKLKPEARAWGVTVSDLARQIYAGYYGEEALRLQRGRDDIRVKVRYPDAERRKLSELDQARIRTPMGRELPLRSVADFSFGPGYSRINRTDGLRRVAVSADVDTNRANAEEVLGDLSSGFFGALTEEFPEVSISVQGAQKDTRESLASLRVGFPIALLGIFVIIATIFRSYIQPVIIMITVPFGIIGAVYGHLAMGYDLTMMSLFGLVALSGVVVNDAIVLIECVNSMMAAGLPFMEAVVRGGARRFRAIFLTTATTCGGLAPMIAERDFQAQFLIPMAISIAAGVLFATLLTLLLVPCLLCILNDVRRIAHFAFAGRWPSREEVEPGRERAADAEGIDAGGVSGSAAPVTE